MMRKFLALLASAGILAASVCVCPIQYTPTQSHVPSSFFQMNIGTFQYGAPYPNFPISTVWLQDDGSFSWGEINTSSGTINWTPLDNYIAQVQTSNSAAKFAYIFLNVPVWAESSSTAQLCTGSCVSSFSTFVTAAVQRYCGVVTTWELWNEPDQSASWAGTAAQMETMSAAAYPIIKSTANCGCTGNSCSPGGGSTNPNTAVSPAISMVLPYQQTWLTNYFTAGGGAYMDVLGFHGYGNGLTPEGLGPNVTVLRSILSAANVNVPIWQTELNWGFTGGPNNLPDQASWTVRSQLILAANNIPVSAWYQFDNYQGVPTNSWGALWSYANGVQATQGYTPAGIAYGYLENWLTGATIQSCIGNSSGTWACPITRSSPIGYRGVIVWNTSGSATYQVPSVMIQSRNIVNSTIKTLIGTPANLVTVGTSPQLFESASAF